jgi:predicted Zn-dependent protease
LFAALAVLLALGTPLAASASPLSQAGPTCNYPESDAEALVILNNYYPNRYWWSDTHLTVAVQAHPNATDAQLEAIHGAIATWANVLEECFDGLITLTDVTGTQPSEQRAADIVVHYVPTAGGVVFGGYAICGARGCPNIIVRSDLPPSYGVDPYSPEYLGLVTLHELGHALGLGHATNLLESTDLMGYGWVGTTNAVLSQCDVDALAFVFAWALEGDAPHPPAAGPFVCGG